MAGRRPAGRQRFARLTEVAPYERFSISVYLLLLLIKLKLNKALDENSSLSYGASYTIYGITQCYLPPDTRERAPP